MKAAFSLFAVLMASAAIHSASYATPRTLPDGGGPRLGRITAELPAFDSVLETSELQRAPTEFFVDLPCNVFLPGKADPQEWMATSTLVYYTLDGIQYQYGYDPFAQSYDMIA